mgnify:CR=1 FL=1
MGTAPMREHHAFWGGDVADRIEARNADEPIVIEGGVSPSGIPHLGHFNEIMRGYYVAAAADRIFANRASLVGSIGVRFGGFGFVEAMDKVGVDRRLITAGENKALMDPFLPEDPEQVAHIQATVDGIHGQFIAAVKEGRGDRLGEDPPQELFSGLIWTGQEALDNGLVDDLASPSQVAREIVGVERTIDYTPRKDLFQRFSDRVGATIAKTLKSEALVPDLR